MILHLSVGVAHVGKHVRLAVLLSQLVCEAEVLEKASAIHAGIVIVANPRLPPTVR